MSFILKGLFDLFMLSPDHKIFKPYYNKANGMTIGFVLSLYFCSKIENPVKKIIYFFYIDNEITKSDLFSKEKKITEKHLLNIIFRKAKNQYYVSKNVLRSIVALENRPTFNKYFDKSLKEKGLIGKRKFKFEELYQVLLTWQGEDDNWIRMEAFSKKELLQILERKVTSGNYAYLEENFTKSTFNSDKYKGCHYISPKMIKQNLPEIPDLHEFIGDDVMRPVEFFHYLYLIKVIEEKMSIKKN